MDCVRTVERHGKNEHGRLWRVDSLGNSAPLLSLSVAVHRRHRSSFSFVCVYRVQGGHLDWATSVEARLPVALQGWDCVELLVHVGMWPGGVVMLVWFILLRVHRLILMFHSLGATLLGTIYHLQGNPLKISSDLFRKEIKVILQNLRLENKWKQQSLFK